MRVALVALMLVACGGPPPAGAPDSPAADLDLDDGPDAGDGDGGDAPGVLDEHQRSRLAEPAPAPAARRLGPRREVYPRRRAYRGRRIDLDVRDADLTNVFRLLATVGGVNIVVAPDVRGTVTLRLRQVPWDQVAEVVARSNQLVIERDQGVWLIRKRRPRSER